MDISNFPIMWSLAYLKRGLTHLKGFVIGHFVNPTSARLDGYMLFE